MVAHETMFAESAIGPDSKRSRLERWTISASEKSVKREILHDHNQEFPRVNEAYTGRSHRYVYSVALSMDADDEILTQPATELFKYDAENRSVQVRDFGKGCHPGEFVFVPSGDGDNEDDGWLMGFVVDGENRTTELIILNAGDITGPAQASIHIPHAVPSGFHGNWV